MKQLAVAAVSALAVAGAAAGLASAADGFSLALVGPLDPAVAGQPAIVEIAGVNSPPSEYHFMTWLQVDVFVPSVVPECPAGTGEANQLAAGTGGAILTIAQREEVNERGVWSIPLGFTPLAPGRCCCVATATTTSARRSRAHH